MEFWRFAAPTATETIEVDGTYDIPLVAISILIAAAGALTMFRAVERRRSADSERQRIGWSISGALSMGLGIWAMHFTGMIAFALPVPMIYNFWLTALSIVPALLGAFAAVDAIGSRRGLTGVNLGAIYLAVGIGGMHYIGMEAMEFDGEMTYDIHWFGASILVAVAAANVSLHCYRFVNRSKHRFLSRRGPAIAALLTGSAVAATHYTAMVAARFDVRPEVLQAEMAMSPLLPVGVVIGVVVLLAAVRASTLIDQRFAEADAALRLSELRNAAVIESMQDSHILIDANATILQVNPATLSVFGYNADELIGESAGLLMPEENYCFLKEYIQEFLETGDSRRLLKPRTGLTGIKKNGQKIPLDFRVTTFSIGGKQYFSGTMRDLSSEREALAQTERLKSAIDQTPETIIILDKDFRVLYANAAVQRTMGYSPASMLGKTLSEFGWARSEPHLYEDMHERMRAGVVWSGTLSTAYADDSVHEEEVTVAPVTSEGSLSHYIQVRRNVTERQQLESQLRQAQKLESIGQLAAGIAHEINTPSQFVRDNAVFLKDAFEDMSKLLARMSEATRSGNEPLGTKEVREWLDEADVDFLLEEIPQALTQSLDGMERITTIVRAMKEFSHQEREKSPANINDGIRSTVTVATNEWKYVAEMVFDLDDSLPLIPCLISEVNQVVLNMVINAAHAIEDRQKAESGAKGTITITTRPLDRWAEIEITDTGAGMTDAVLHRVFDPFYTTKEVGKGTGQGLSIAYAVIVDKHGGTIDVRSEPGNGTTFTIRLPLDDTSSSDRSAAA